MAPISPSSDSDIDITFQLGTTQESIDILFRLGTTQDPETKDRIQVFLQWVRDMSIGSSSSLKEYGLSKSSPSHLHCVAAILWHSFELPVDYDLPALLDRELFELVYNWSMSLPSDERLMKTAVDSLLCSMCHINPNYFSLLMSWMGIVAQHHRPSMADVGQKQHANTTADSCVRRTDDSEHARWPVNLSVSQLATLAAASQSPRAIKQLLDSGFPSLLVQSLYQLCCGLLASANQPLPAVSTAHHQAHSALSPPSQQLLSAEMAVPVLHFLTEVGNSHAMKDWLGGTEVSMLWTALLFLLCHSKAKAGALGGAGCPTTLEDATMAFFLRCISGHPNNQRLMAQLLCELLQPAPQRGTVPVSENISGFIQKHLLKLLEQEKVTVFVESPFPLYKGLKDKDATGHVIQHPMYGLGHKYHTLHLPISTTLAEVLCQGEKREVPFSFHIYHKLLPGHPLPVDLTLAQLLTLLYKRKLPLGYRSIDLTVISNPGLSKMDSLKRKRTEKVEPMTLVDECPDMAIDESLLDTSPIESSLEVFAGMGGLSLFSEMLPMLYSNAIHKNSEMLPMLYSNAIHKKYAWHWSQTMSPINKHSLVAFDLFLRLPSYVDILRKKHARYLLHTISGLTCERRELLTLPFHMLQELFSSTPLTLNDGVLLRHKALEIGAINHILSCVSTLSQVLHFPNSSPSKEQLYWPKGTGFSSWPNRSTYGRRKALTLTIQHLQEDYVICLLQVLASYINPEGSAGGHGGFVPTGDDYTNSSSSTAWLSMLQEVLRQSCLIPFMSSYLCNDSLMDMAHHVPLYRALMELLRAISTWTALVPLLLPLSGEECSKGQTSISTLLAKMKTCADMYTNCLSSKKCKSRGMAKMSSDAEPDGLTLLVSEIQRTAEIVFTATKSVRQDDQERKPAESSKKELIPRSLEEKYFATMKKLQFDMFDMASENNKGKLVFHVNYHYKSMVNNESSAARARRLAQEVVTLSTSLPLSSSSSVFVRCDDERLDIMKVLITGPAGSPYANGCFEFDVFFPKGYPNSPPHFNLETTGGQTVRFNPNIYNNGKVCLSILNTWQGERWKPQSSSLLQVLVSLQSLVLVPEPYFNEPGYECQRGIPGGTKNSRQYNANVRQATVKWAMLEQMLNPSPCFKEVIHKHFYLKQSEIMAQCKEWISDSRESYLSHHAATLKHHTATLQKELLKLPCPKGLEPN